MSFQKLINLSSCLGSYLVVLVNTFKDILGAKVGGQYDYGVLEIYRSALRVGDTAVIKYLEQNVEYIGVSLLDLIEEDYGVRLAANSLSQLTALLITNISRRRSDKTAHGVFLHVLGHVDTDNVLFIVKQCLCQSLCKLGLTNTCRTHEEEGTDRTGGVLYSRS